MLAGERSSHPEREGRVGARTVKAPVTGTGGRAGAGPGGIGAGLGLTVAGHDVADTTDGEFGVP
ncbi:hypothetical protein GCM10010307_75810 [Streptomyces vastus]|uniref:Uncharacterized protein n=1 Tax=Streptomyces vastus TaxID=285451 RepID=A0ABN3RS20_9ACTN